MAYVGTFSTQDGTLIEAQKGGFFARARALFREELGRQLIEARRELSVDRALRDLDRRQLTDIGICRDAC